VARGDRVLAGELAARVRLFAALAPDRPLLPSPLPGVIRWLGLSDLQHLAAQANLEPSGVISSQSDVCIELAVTPLGSDQVRQALELALPNAFPHERDLRLELADYSKIPVPCGEIHFARPGLLAGPAAKTSTAVLWRGQVRYANGAGTGHRSVPIWAKVRLFSVRELVLAAHDIPAGKVIQRSDLSLERRELFPLAPPCITEAGTAVGRKVRRDIRSGEAIQAPLLIQPHLVERGETVTVHVASGAAQLTLRARAESSGFLGDTVLLLNPANKRRFKAVVQARSVARLDASANSFLTE
jgi:flagella basal body P-ring formation protein FlgA